MTWPALAFGAGVLAFVVFYRAIVEPVDWKYPVNESQPRAPGLPSDARRAGAYGSALAAVRDVADREGLGLAFVRAVERLARNESGATFALPAISFNFDRNRPPLVTAWGCFQYNASAWRRCTGKAGVFPWDASAREEIEAPIQREYARVWRDARAAGANDYYAERLVRLWHMAPAYVDDTLARARRDGWAAAWRAVPTYTTPTGRVVDPRATIERKLA